MSEKSRWLELHYQICELDEQFRLLESRARELKERIYKTGPPNAANRCRVRAIVPEARYLRKVYDTGHINRPSLPRHWEPLRPAGAPKISDELYELLSLKRKRGRPRNETLQALAQSQRCSERHARRLFASGKQRKRARQSPTPDEQWALQQRQKRAELVRALGQEDAVNRVALMLDILHRGLETACLSSQVSRLARQLGEKMVAEQGIATALLIRSFALGSTNLRHTAKTLAMTRSTFYRRFRGKLRSLRTHGEYLADQLQNVDSSEVDSVIRSKPRRRLVTESENAWTAQTTWQPRSQRRTH